MRVKNRKCIRRLSFKSLWASRKRNIIAICAIALTTLMFTSLFTIMLSVNSSYETYNFRQAGGYSDGIFKDLSREQTDKIAAHKGIKASGERIVCGFSSSDVFGKGDSILVDVSIEGFDDGLFDKLTVVKGSLEPLSDPDSHAIAVAVSTDDYGNIVNLDNYPELGDTYTVNYQIGYDIDSRTGERADQQTTPEEYLEYHEEEAKEVEYSVCALVTVPDSISFRYTSLGYSMVLPVEKLKEDSGTDVIPKFYMFDTPDSQAEASAEQYLQKLTAGDTSTLMYESKASIRREFTRFKNMFLICGGALCAIIGLVGILNFFNAIMTGILSRKREFAVLQSVGMTKRQLKLMLIYEGLFYAVGSIIASLILSVVLSPMLGNMMSAMFWFVTYHFTIMPVILIIPVFLLLGWLIPAVLYHAGKRQSIVENLREL